MSTPRRYAAGTGVTATKSRAEIESLLKRHGATSFVSGWDDELSRAALVFRLAGRHFRLEVSQAQEKDVPPTARYEAPAQHKARVGKWIAGEERRRWRALLLVIKAKLEMIASGESSVEREFLADMLLPNGDTVATSILPRIAESYASGKMPRRLLPALGSGDDK